MSSLGEMLPIETARCRALILIYAQLGESGVFGMVALEELLQRTDRAMIEQDLVGMLQCYTELKECE